MADTFRETVRLKNATVQVSLERGWIDPKKHVFRNGPDGLLMDGLLCYGLGFLTNPETRLSYLSKIEVLWNGRKIFFPDRTCRHIFTNSLRPRGHTDARDGTVLVVPSPLNDSILIQLSGGDAGESYTLWWAVRKEGVGGFYYEGPI
jgi:hypothetical protein